MPAGYTSATLDAAAEATTAVKTRVALVSVKGTGFTGTIQFRYRMLNPDSGTEHIVQEDGANLELTADGSRVLDFGVPVWVYGYCSARSAGSAEVEIKSATLSSAY